MTKGWRKKQKALLERAKMTVYQLNTGVVIATDRETSKLRIMVSGSYNTDYNDCIGVGFMSELDLGKWQVMSLSPTRARILAYELLDRADIMEEEYPEARDIDKADND